MTGERIAGWVATCASGCAGLIMLRLAISWCLAVVGLPPIHTRQAGMFAVTLYLAWLATAPHALLKGSGGDAEWRDAPVWKVEVFRLVVMVAAFGVVWLWTVLP